MCRLQIHQDLREDLAKVKTLDGLAHVSKQLKQRCQVVNALQNSRENIQVLSDVLYVDVCLLFTNLIVFNEHRQKARIQI